MKIAITGHTNKLGKEIFDTLKINNEIIGFSRTNGFNINKSEDIINESINCDIFINNTYYKNYQTEIFVKLFNLWKDLPKTIINLNSSCVNHSSEWNPEYAGNKKNLKSNMWDLVTQYPNKKVRVINLYPSTLNSDIGFEQFNKINIKYLSNIIEWVINQPQEIEFREITIYSTSEKKEFKIDKLI
jgi:hypothetical protein